MANNKGNSVLDDVKSGLKGIHSAGEAIRGTFNESVDHAFNDKAGEAKNQAIAEKGVSGVKQADEHIGHHHGVGTNTGVRTGGIGTVEAGDTTGAGTHSAAPGNIGGTNLAAGGVAEGARAPAQEQPGSTQRY